MRIRSRFFSAVVVFTVLTFWILSAPVPAQTVVQHYRDMEVYYGTGQSFSTLDNSLLGSIDGLQLTDMITSNLANSIFATYPEPRVTDHIGEWIDDSVSEMDWVLGTPQNLPASDTLLAQISDFPGTPVSVNDTGDVFITEQVYLIALWTTTDEQGNQIDHEGYARVRFFERTYQEFVAVCATETTTKLSDTVIRLGQSVWDKATVTDLGTCSSRPTGTVTFQVSTDGGATWTTFGSPRPLGSRGHALSNRYTPQETGIYYFRAIYSGDEEHAGSQSGDTEEKLTVRRHHR